MHNDFSIADSIRGKYKLCYYIKIQQSTVSMKKSRRKSDFACLRFSISAVRLSVLAMILAHFGRFPQPFYDQQLRLKSLTRQISATSSSEKSKISPVNNGSAFFTDKCNRRALLSPAGKHLPIGVCNPGYFGIGYIENLPEIVVLALRISYNRALNPRRDSI